MERRRFGNTDMDVSVLGFGGAEIGFQGASQADVNKLLNGALDAGLNIIDTAECYINSEELIGKAVAGRRSDFYLFTKCGHKDNYDEDAWAAADLARSIDRSLKRLQTDYVDLIQLHSCSLEHLKQGDVITVLQKAKQDGKARYIGYSGDGQAARFAIETGAFDALQTSVSIADQEALELTLPLARARALGVIAKRPVANAAWRDGRKPANEYAQPYWERLQKLKYDFINGDLARSIAIALRFTLSVSGIHTAIVGTRQPGRWLENARMVAEGLLPESEFESIRARWKEVAAPDWHGEV